MSHPIDDYYAVYRETFPRSQSPQRCDACDEAIAAGQRFARAAIVSGGRAENVIRCMRCQRIHEHLRNLDPDAWPEERLDCGTDYEDEWGGPPPDEIVALAFALPGEVE